MKSISEGGDDPVFRFYRDLIVAKINDEPHYYHREVMQHLFSALFCEMLGQLHKEIDAPDKGDSPKEGIKQAIIPCGNSWSYYRKTRVCTVL